MSNGESYWDHVIAADKPNPLCGIRIVVGWVIDNKRGDATPIANSLGYRRLRHVSKKPPGHVFMFLLLVIFFFFASSSSVSSTVESTLAD